MPLPEPKPGLVLSFSYLWQHEKRAGEDGGRKNRPCVVVSAVEKTEQGITVTVTAITHRPPSRSGEAVKIPLAVKKHLGLDTRDSWIVVTEANQFNWPGFDLRPVPGTADRYDYGFLPPRLFEQVKVKLLDQFMARRAVLIKRD